MIRLVKEQGGLRSLSDEIRLGILILKSFRDNAAIKETTVIFTIISIGTL